MRQLFLLIIFSTVALCAYSQSKEESAPLPEKLQQLEMGIQVNHFPSPVHAVSVSDEEGSRYFWKHNTAVMAPFGNVTIIECGAYIFYNDQWNLRVTYATEDFADLFDCPEGKMEQGQPYTFVKNWRGDTRLYAGWALWYFIGEDELGKQVGGYARLETTGLLVGEATTIN